MRSSLSTSPATELVRRIRIGDVSPVELTEASLRRVRNREDLNAFITLIEDDARERAIAAERAVEQGDELGALHGIPVVIKDLTGFKAGVRHTFGCKLLSDNVADHTAVFVERLEEAGAIVLGKTNTPEFGHKPTTDNMLVGPTSTPFDAERNAGGSSGGSAAAVAAGMTTLGQGGDAFGSVRIPAALCGVYGLKPSFGRIPSPTRPNGFLNNMPFIDKGPITRTVGDAALMMEVMAGPHPSDPFSLPDDGTDYVDAVERPIDGLDVAYSPDLGVFPVAESVDAIVSDAVTAFEEAGANVDDIDVNFGHSLADLREGVRYPLAQLMAAKVTRIHEEAHDIDFIGEHRDDIPDELSDRIEAGREFDTLAIDAAQRLRTDVFDTVQSIFEEYDLLLTPTVSVPPFRNDVAEQVVGPLDVDGEPIDAATDWILTWPFNLTGNPAASVPAGFTDDDLPVGMQLVGRRFDDDVVLAASGAFERARPWHDAYQRIE